MRTRRAFLPTALPVFCVLLCAPCPAAADAAPIQALASESGELSVAIAPVPDSRLDGAPAAFAALPRGWTLAQRGVYWNLNWPGRPDNGLAGVYFEVKGPADEACFGMLPQMTNSLPNDPFIQQPPSAEDFIKRLLPSAKESARITVKKVTKPRAMIASLEKVVSELKRSERLPMRWMHMWSPPLHVTAITSDCALAEVAFSTKEGEYEGAFLVGIFYITTSLAPGVRSYLPVPPTVGWSTTPILALTARTGKLEAHTEAFVAIIGNSLVNPAWEEAAEYASSYVAGRQWQITPQENDRLWRNLRQRYDQTVKTSPSPFDRRRTTMGNVSRGWADAIAGTDTWKDGDAVYLAPAGYGEGWIGPGRRMFFTRTPGGTLRAPWRPMEKIPRNGNEGDTP